VPRLPATPAWLRDNVLFFGDITVLDAVVAALLRVPAPVLEHTLSESCFQSVGAETRAWTASSVFVDRDGRGRPRTIMLSGAAPHRPYLLNTALHEIAHSWSCPTPSVSLTAVGEENFVAYLAAEGRAELGDTKQALDERVAHALAQVWESEDA